MFINKISNICNNQKIIDLNYDLDLNKNEINNQITNIITNFLVVKINSINYFLSLIYNLKKLISIFYENVS